jgi:hypothetical protein
MENAEHEALRNFRPRLCKDLHIATVLDELYAENIITSYDRQQINVHDRKIVLSHHYSFVLGRKNRLR